jgi:hypothetical protein
MREKPRTTHSEPAANTPADHPPETL